MNFYISLPLLSATLTIFLGLLVFFKNPSKDLNRVFFLFSVFVTIWLGGSAILLLNCGNEARVLFWDRIVYAGVIFIPPTCLHFSSLFSGTRKQKSIIMAGYVTALLFFIVSRTDYFIYGFIKYPWGCHSKAGALHGLFIVFFALFIFFVFRNLTAMLKRTAGVERLQVKYILIAFITLGFGALGFLPAYGVNFYPYTYVCGTIAVFIITYAIVRHRLMDIRVVLRQYSVYAASLFTVIAIILAIKYLMSLYFDVFSSWIWFLVLVLGIIIFPQLKDYYYRVANKYFFSSLYDAREVIADLSEKLKATLEVKMIYAFVSGTLINVLHIKTVTVLIWNAKMKAYEAAFDAGHARGERNNFIEESGFYAEVIKRSRVIIADEMKEEFGEKYGRTIAVLKKYDIHVLVPLLVKDKIIGLLALGPKESGDMYNHEDVQVLEIVGAQAAIAMENALLYKETKDFNVTLKKEVERATGELKEAYRKLKELDMAKSDFISIASHQLRTPLSIIKGYISMMLEGNFGRLTDKKRSALNKVFLSNERLIRLVENLLNISRIESGKLQYDFEKMPLDELVRDVIDELSGTARGKGLKIDAELPKDTLPPVNADEEKLRQVVMNLIDNAIKYTTKGSIAVSLKRAGDALEFCVSDSGMGIRQKDMPNLFKKFSRGTGTFLVHTEGTGLGLFVAKKVIDAHSGKIWAESKGAGKGSKFCFKLPILKDVKIK